MTRQTIQSRNQEICRRYYLNGESLQEIADDLKLSRNSIWQIIQRERTRENVTLRQTAKAHQKLASVSAEQYARAQRKASRIVEREVRQQMAVRLLKQRVSEREIAQRLGISIGTVRALVAPHRLQLHADQLETFRVLRDAGKSYEEIANATGYSILTVREWLNLSRKVAQEADAWLREQQQTKQAANAWLAQQVEECA